MARQIFQINTEVWLSEQSWFDKTSPDLSKIPEAQIKQWVHDGYDIIWFLGVWKKGHASMLVARQIDAKHHCFSDNLPNATEEDIVGSPFAIADYSLNPAYGEAESLERLRKKLHDHHLNLMLDFVPNHMAVDHRWVSEAPQRLVAGTAYGEENDPANFFHPACDSSLILAHGRDPFFAGWSDTVQINYFNKDARRAMTDILLEIAAVCDGIRCDMAMLLINEVFQRTWGDIWMLDYGEEMPAEFWTDAIAEVKKSFPEFIFLAEVYWDMEPKLIEMGFDSCYDKTLYDKLLEADGPAVYQHLTDSQDWQEGLVRFVENHDEDRASDAFGKRHMAAAAFCASLPGVMLYHEGQSEGRKEKVAIQMGRRCEEETDLEMQQFYRDLLSVVSHPIFKTGELQPIELTEEWEENKTHQGIVACWRSNGKNHRLIVANISNKSAQAFCPFPMERIRAKTVELKDLMSSARYFRSSKSLRSKGLYLDLPAAGFHIFDVRNASSSFRPNDRA